MQLTAVVTTLIGLTLLLWPEKVLTWFIPEATGDFFVRFIGSALLGYAFLNWMSAQIHDQSLRQVALNANIVTLSIATCLSVVGVIGREVQQHQWLLISEHVLFLSGFIYARHINQQVSR